MKIHQETLAMNRSSKCSTNTYCMSQEDIHGNVSAFYGLASSSLYL